MAQMVLKIRWISVLMIALGATFVYADEIVTGEFIGLDKSKMCLQIDSECYEISASQKSGIIRQAARLDEGSLVLVRLDGDKVVEFGKIELQSQPN